MTSVRPSAAKARIAPRFGKSLAAGLLACCCVFAAPPLLAQSNVSAKLIPVAKRKSAPDIPLVSSTGATQDLVSYDGKVVLLNFWATACGGCVLEIPSIVQIQNSFHGKPFTAVGVSMDVSYEGLKGPAQAWSRVRPFMHSHHVDYPILMANQAMVHAYKIKALPDTFLIDRHGRIAAVYHGTIDPANVEANIRALLGETAHKGSAPCDVKPVPCSVLPGTQAAPGALTLAPESQTPGEPSLTAPSSADSTPSPAGA